MACCMNSDYVIRVPGEDVTGDNWRRMAAAWGGVAGGALGGVLGAWSPWRHILVSGEFSAKCPGQ